MKLEWADETRAVIRVTLSAGDTLVGLIGPVEVFVPVDPNNRHFAELGPAVVDIPAAPPILSPANRSGSA
jgi:hypothetical protein